MNQVFKPVACLGLLLCTISCGSDAVDSEGSPSPTDAERMDAQDRVDSAGNLWTQVTNPSSTALIPVTKVNMRPDSSTETNSTFSTTFSISTTSGTLAGVDAVNWLLDELDLSSILLTCSNGTPLLLNAYASCPGATLQERQTRVMTFVGLPGNALILDPSSVIQPYITFKMKATQSVLKTDGSTQRVAPSDGTSSSGGKEYVVDMGMHW